MSRGRREIRGGYELLEVPLPAVVSVKTACNEPRFMDFRLKPWAFEEQSAVTVWDAGDLDSDPTCIGFEGSPTVVTDLAEAPTRERKRQFLEGSQQEIVQQLASILQKEQLSLGS